MFGSGNRWWCFSVTSFSWTDRANDPARWKADATELCFDSTEVSFCMRIVGDSWPTRLDSSDCFIIQLRSPHFSRQIIITHTSWAARLLKINNSVSSMDGWWSIEYSRIQEHLCSKIKFLFKILAIFEYVLSLFRLKNWNYHRKSDSISETMYIPSN